MSVLSDFPQVVIGSLAVKLKSIEMVDKPRKRLLYIAPVENHNKNFVKKAYAA